jgi:hypothetical protein
MIIYNKCGEMQNADVKPRPVALCQRLFPRNATLRKSIGLRVNARLRAYFIEGRLPTDALGNLSFKPSDFGKNVRKVMNEEM